MFTAFYLMLASNLAESEGFEPPDLLQSTVFKTAAIDHSANSPEYRRYRRFQWCKYRIIYCITKIFLAAEDF